MVVKKLGQPVPDSNFISEVKSGRPQPAQAKIPARFSLFSGLVPARSVPSSRITWKDSAGSFFFHSSLESFTGSVGGGTFAPAGRKVFQFFCSSSMPFIFAGGGGAACLPPDERARELCRGGRFLGLPSRSGSALVARGGR